MSAHEKPLRWRKSSFSQNGDCVECVPDEEYVYVRDSKSAVAVALKFTYDKWRAFIAMVKSGGADLAATDNRQMQDHELLVEVTDYGLF